jgi:MFS family permease
MEGVPPVLPRERPVRLLAASTLVNTLGKGLYLTGSALFFTRSVGLSPAAVGVGLTISGLLGMVAGVALGHVSDRVGPREVTLALLGVEAVTVALFVFVHSFEAFLVVACLAAIGERGNAAVRAALIAAVGPPDRRVAVRAYMRSVTNVGISVGALLAGLALHADTRAGYEALMLGDAATFLIAGAFVARLAHIPPVPAPAAGPRFVALRDRGYLAVTALNGILSFQFVILTLAMPLWLVGHTGAPRWMVSPLLLCNTLLVVALQVRASRGSESVHGAALAVRRSGWALAGACVIYAAADGRGALVASLLLVAAVVVHTVGELLQSAGGFGLSYDLAPDHAQGQYQGVFALGMNGAAAFAPAVLTTLCLGAGAPGWIALGAVFVVAGAATPPVARLAVLRRPALATAG